MLYANTCQPSFLSVTLSDSAYARKKGTPMRPPFRSDLFLVVVLAVRVAAGTVLAAVV